MLFIDLDDFKTFNDSFGHGAGDELLIAVARRLRDSVRPDDAIARLGGDEFAVMVSDERSVNESATMVAERIMKAFEQPVSAAGEIIFVHLSIGIATTHDSHDADELIRNADLAMYRAKESGKGRHAMFDPGMRDAVLKRHGLKEELQRAVERGQLIVEYQPIVSLETGDVSAAEALVRWNHPGRGRLLPSEFVPLAEETGMIIALGQFVLEEACCSARAWQDSARGRAGIGVHVNLSAVELKDPNLPATVEAALEHSGLDANLLVLEITESLLQDAESSQAALRALRGLGVRLALDDFGTGYSSLSYLRELPLDILKIAKPFVEGMARGSQESSFARMIIDLARALDLHVVAEGIESAEELDALTGSPLRARSGLLPGDAAGARRGAQGAQPVRRSPGLAALTAVRQAAPAGAGGQLARDLPGSAGLNARTGPIGACTLEQRSKSPTKSCRGPPCSPKVEFGPPAEDAAKVRCEVRTGSLDAPPSPEIDTEVDPLVTYSAPPLRIRWGFCAFSAVALLIVAVSLSLASPTASVSSSPANGHPAAATFDGGASPALVKLAAAQARQAGRGDRAVQVRRRAPRPACPGALERWPRDRRPARDQRPGGRHDRRRGEASRVPRGRPRDHRSTRRLARPTTTIRRRRRLGTACSNLDEPRHVLQPVDRRGRGLGQTRPARASALR